MEFNCFGFFDYFDPCCYNCPYSRRCEEYTEYLEGDYY